jgi:hypothetical protein
MKVWASGAPAEKRNFVLNITFSIATTAKMH